MGLFWSCEPPVVFSELQPKGAEVLTSIPKNFQRTYGFDKDSIGLYVDKFFL